MKHAQYLKEIDRVIQEGSYKDNWESLSRYQTPAWFTEARFGIFIHWGLFSVPSYDNEWYPRNMYMKDNKAYEHHIKTYGPHKEFGHKDFIPLFRAERFDPAHWAKLFSEAGAAYVCPVAEHHDGFQMYKSDLSHYNAFEMGPKRDVLGELKAAIEHEGMVFCSSSHRAEHWFFMGHGKEFDSDVKEPLVRGDFYWPAMPEPEFFAIDSQSPTDEYLEDWLVRTCEIIDNYRPRVLYFDWWIHHIAFKPYLKKLAAFYYNRAEQWGQQVVINYKHDAMMFGCGVVEIERGKLGAPTPYAWQSDTATARNSWCYTAQNEYKPVNEILCDLADIVSKNGNLLLNVGPKPDGTISEEETAILAEIGAWMRTNGEAIKGTRPWRRFGEGPTQVPEGMFSEGAVPEFTPGDMRFTVKGSHLYAIVLRCPDDGRVTITSLAEKKEHDRPVFHGVIKDVTVLGAGQAPAWHRDENGLTVTGMDIKSTNPVVIKILLD